MSLYSHLTNHPKSTLSEIETAYDGNLCRCTGYRPLLDAAKSFASDKALLSSPTDESLKALKDRAEVVTTSGMKSSSQASWILTYQELDSTLDYPAKSRTGVEIGGPRDSLSLRLLDEDPDAMIHSPTELKDLLLLVRCLPQP